MRELIDFIENGNGEQEWADIQDRVRFGCGDIRRNLDDLSDKIDEITAGFEEEHLGFFKSECLSCDRISMGIYKPDNPAAKAENRKRELLATQAL